MSTNLPDFSKADYVAEPELGLTSGYEPRGNPWSDGAPAGSFAPALVGGIGAAIVGSIGYATFTIATHITIGFVALFLGAFIATAMIRQTDGYGGRKYQILAALLTYLSVCGAVVIEIFWAYHSRGIHVSTFSTRQYIWVLSMGLASPILEFRHFVSGAIDLFILFLAVRSAWKVAAGKQPTG
jgi:uncharacterized membrane protein